MADEKKTPDLGKHEELCEATVQQCAAVAKLKGEKFDEDTANHVRAAFHRMVGPERLATVPNGPMRAVEADGAAGLPAWLSPILKAILTALLAAL
jgi:hypothetical protein